MIETTIQGVTVYSLPKTWWHVTYSHHLEMWIVVEVISLPEMEDLSYFRERQEDAIELARKENSILLRKRARGKPFTV